MVLANVSSLAKGYHISKTIFGSHHPFIASVSDCEIHRQLWQMTQWMPLRCWLEWRS